MVFLPILNGFYPSKWQVDRSVHKAATYDWHKPNWPNLAEREDGETEGGERESGGDRGWGERREGGGESSRIGYMIEGKHKLKTHSLIWEQMGEQ